MDITFDEILNMLADPATRDEAVEKVKASVTVLEDENGEKMRIAVFKDAVMMEKLLLGGEILKGFRFHDIRSTPLRDDDIMVIDYPKSGTHWLCNLIYYMLKSENLDEVISYQPPLLEMFPEEVVDKMPSRRVLTTHRGPDSVPRDIFKSKGKPIILYRNPKDTAVSLYYHFKGIAAADYNISWNCHIDRWMKGLVPICDYFQFYQSWEKALENNPDFEVLLVCYEDLKKDCLKELRRISKYLDLDLSDKRIQEVIDRCSLKNLKKDVESGAVKSPLVNKDGKSVLYRKGIIGDWKNHFTVAQNEQIDALIEAKSPRKLFNREFQL